MVAVERIKGMDWIQKDTEELKLTDEMGAEEVEKVTPRFLACVEDSGGRQGLEMRYSWTPESDFGNICQKGCFIFCSSSIELWFPKGQGTTVGIGVPGTLVPGPPPHLGYWNLWVLTPRSSLSFLPLFALHLQIQSATDCVVLYYRLKKICASGPAQFKSTLFRNQLYSW